MFLRVPLTHLDRWLAFFTKFPRDYRCSQTINYLAVDNAQTADNKHTGSMIFPFFLRASKTDKPLGDDTFRNQSVKLIC